MTAETVNRAAILASLDAAAERGDPMPVVYRRLFEAYPETRKLFVLGELAKGNMLDQVFQIVLDVIGPRDYGHHLVRAEIVNHENLGVPPRTFVAFFAIVRDALREVVAESWTAGMESAWSDLLAEFEAIALAPATAAR